MAYWRVLLFKQVISPFISIGSRRLSYNPLIFQWVKGLKVLESLYYQFDDVNPITSTLLLSIELYELHFGHRTIVFFWYLNASHQMNSHPSFPHCTSTTKLSALPFAAMPTLNMLGKPTISPSHCARDRSVCQGSRLVRNSPSLSMPQVPSLVLTWM